MSESNLPRDIATTEVTPPKGPPRLAIVAPPPTRTTRVNGVVPPVASPPGRHATWLSAIHDEIRALGSPPPRPGTSTLTTLTDGLFGESGPVAIIKRKVGRFRLPRALKTELIDRFCSQDPIDHSALTALIVVAHPDDESIGAGARLSRLGDAYVVGATDGAPRDPECLRRHGFDNADEYAEVRRRELHAAMAVAGLPPERLISLDFADGEADFRLAELCLRVTEIIDTIRPQVVITHPYEGGHTDHDATAFAVHVSCGVLRREGVSPPAILELASYHANNGEKVVQRFLPHARADRGQRIITLDEDERELKQRMFDCFATQRGVLEQFSPEFERFRPAPRYVFTEPPHLGTLNYERYGNPERGRSWREHALDVLRSLGMRPD